MMRMFFQLVPGMMRDTGIAVLADCGIKVRPDETPDIKSVDDNEAVFDIPGSRRPKKVKLPG